MQGISSALQERKRLLTFIVVGGGPTGRVTKACFTETVYPWNIETFQTMHSFTSVLGPIASFPGTCPREMEVPTDHGWRMLRNRQVSITFQVQEACHRVSCRLCAGVEVAAEIYDLLNEDMKSFYPGIISLACVMLVELQDHILSTYDREISEYASTLFSRQVVSRPHDSPSMCLYDMRWAPNATVWVNSWWQHDSLCPNDLQAGPTNEMQQSSPWQQDFCPTTQSVIDKRLCRRQGFNYTFSNY